MDRYDDWDAKVVKHSFTASNDRLHFFKYMSAKTAQIVLRNRTLRWSTPGYLNDPLDMQFEFRLELDREAVIPRAIGNLWAIYNGDISPGDGVISKIAAQEGKMPKRSEAQFREDMRGLINRSMDRLEKLWPKLIFDLKEKALTAKVLCFTDRPNVASMWNHYADAHRGVVLRFRSIPAFDSPYALAEPVKYMPQVPLLHELDELVDFYSGLARLKHKRVLHDLVYTKSIEWAPEREWRIFHGDGRNKTTEPEDITFNRNELDGVIFGKNCSDNDRQTLEELAARYPNVQLYNARVEGGFGLAIYSIG